jgi:hypothetical protein
MIVLVGLVMVVLVPGALALIAAFIQGMLWLDPEYRSYKKYPELYKHHSSRWH